MAKLIRKKKKIKLDGLLSIVFTISLFLYLGSTTLLKSYNLSMNHNLQNIIDDNAMKQRDIESLKIELSKYTESNYLMAAVESNGSKATYDLNRIIHIQEEEGKNESK